MPANCFSSWGLCPQTPYRGFAPGTQWGLPSPDPLGYSPQIKIPDVAIDSMDIASNAACGLLENRVRFRSTDMDIVTALGVG